MNTTNEFKPAASGQVSSRSRAWSRREMLRALSAAAALMSPVTSVAAAATASKKRLGVCIYSYNFQWRAAREAAGGIRFNDTVGFIEYCHSLGAGGVQIAVGSKEQDVARRVRSKIETLGMYFEGQVTLPRDASDGERFETDVRLAREAGATIVRAAALSGRRYETFTTAEAFRDFEKRSWRSVELAEPILRKHRVRLALENHKDWLVSEFVAALRRIDSEYVGVCVDTGNNIALLEDPMSVVEALAPYAASVHIKDMAVQPSATGFLLSEVPFGDGFLDVKQMAAVLEKANPSIQFNLEMITRDPLVVPCLTDNYWATMQDRSARDLASTLALVRQHPPRKPLPATTGLDSAGQIRFEDENVRACFAASDKAM